MCNYRSFWVKKGQFWSFLPFFSCFRPFSRHFCANTLYAHYQNGEYQNTWNMRPSPNHALCMNSTVEHQPNGYSAICQGDSGGPLVHKDKLFGIVSYNWPPCDGGLPQVFVSVAHFLQGVVNKDWLNSNSDYDPEADFWCDEYCDEHSCITTTEAVITTGATTTTEAATEQLRKVPRRCQHGANTVPTRCPTRCQYGANTVLNTVPIRCQHGANTVLNTVPTRCPTRCQHGANTVPIRCQ